MNYILHFKGPPQPAEQVNATDAAKIIRSNFASREEIKVMEERLQAGKRVYVRNGYLRRGDLN